MSTHFRTNFLLKAGFRSLLLVAMPLGLLAQAPSDVRVDLTAKRVVVNGDQESLVPADKAKPGEVIQYEAVYRNTGKAAAKNVAATVPIPQGMALVTDSAKPAADQASLDGKKFSAVPLLREVKNDAGGVE